MPDGQTLSSCATCRVGITLPFGITMAFQPIIDLPAHRLHAFEVLVRGVEGQSAADVIGRVTPELRYAFDQECRTTAIQLSSRLGIVATGARLSIDFMPEAVYHPEDLQPRHPGRRPPHGFSDRPSDL